MGCANSATEASIVKSSTMNLTICQVMPLIINRANPQRPVPGVKIELPVIRQDPSVTSQKISPLAVMDNNIIIDQPSPGFSNRLWSNLAHEPSHSHRSRLSERKPLLSPINMDHQCPMGDFQFIKLKKSSSVSENPRKPVSVDGDSIGKFIKNAKKLPNVVTGDSATWKKPQTNPDCQMPKVSIQN
jgi:hypothetical protein